MKVKKKLFPGDIVVISSDADKWRDILKGDMGVVTKANFSEFSPDLIEIDLFKTLGERTYRMHTYEVDVVSNKMTYNGGEESKINGRRLSEIL